ncbi:MAG: BrnT family toxin [Acidobacteria bacterium]|nr:BrnT family toxin [Acidobacteriota bacterium]
MEVEDLSDFEGFDWDRGNRDKNLVRHDVQDAECEEVFFNTPLLLFDDNAHSKSERRHFALGLTNGGRPLMVVFTVRKKLIRVISARDMNRRERKVFIES